MSDLYALVQRLRTRPRPSRNRHFEELSHPVARRARKLVRRLDTIERDLAAGELIDVRREGRGVRLTIAFADVRLQRVAYLTDEEHALLSADPALAAKLAL